MKKNIILSVALAAATTMGLVSCDKSSPKMDDKTPASAQKSGECAKIAYVEVDSIQKTLATKQQQLQAAAANFQQKIQQNAYTREQAEAIQAGLQKQNNDLQVLNQRLSAEFQTETDNFNKALHDSLQHYLAFYNKDKKYSLIFSKQGDNLLYADKAYDITNEVVAGLNKAYKGKATADKAKK